MPSGICGPGRRTPSLLYLKLNTWNCDPLGEDPASPDVKSRSLGLLAQADSDLENAIPRLGRRVDHLQRRYNHVWQEVVTVVLWGEKPFTIDESEFRALQLMDGKRNVREIVERMGDETPWLERVSKLRYLASRGAIDLLPATRTVPSKGCEREAALAGV